MNVPVRLPRIAAAGDRVVVESVAVEPGASLRTGDLLLILRAGGQRIRFHSELAGTLRDLRAQAGDELMADRVVLWIESPEPPPIVSVAAFRSVPESEDPARIPFHLPTGLVAPRAPVVAKLAVRAGNSLAAGTVCFEVAIGPLRFDFCVARAGVVAEVLVREGDELTQGGVVLRLADAAETGKSAQPGSESGAPLPKAPGVREVPEMTLAEFRQSTRTLRHLVGEMAEVVAAAGLKNSTDLLRAEIAGLADPRFSVAVMGEFKRGKSTFLNALAGAQFLPTDVVPCTAFACRFQYAEQLEMALVGLDGVERRAPQRTMPEIAAELDRLTRDPNAQIREAVVRLPLALCRDGVDLIDTPGLNDSEAMNRVALSILPNVDAAFLLLIPESPLSETERSFLGDYLLGRDLGRLLFVLNAKDRVPEQKLPRLVEYLQGQIDRILAAREQTEIAHGQLFCVSARNELATPGGDQSGFAELRRQLHRLLFQQRGRLTLTQSLQRISRAAHAAQASTQLRLAQMATSRESFAASLAEIERQVSTTRQHANEARRRIYAAQTQVDAVVAEQAQQLHVALLALRETLPQEIQVEWVQKSAKEQVRAQLTALLQQQSGRLYQQALSQLLERVRAAFDPVSRSAWSFVALAERAFTGLAGSVYQRATGTQAADDRRRVDLQLSQEADFRGAFAVRVELSLGALSWLLLVESARSFLSTGEMTATLEARAVAALRENYAREIGRQVLSMASPAILVMRMGEVARRPFEQLLNRLDQEMTILLDDSNALLASLRAGAADGHDADRARKWQELLARIEGLWADCENAVCRGRDDGVALAS